VSADAAAVQNYLPKAEGARLLSEAWALPRHDGKRRFALAALGALVGVLAGAVGAASARRSLAGP
jgi:uncharacterized protein involved in exopolysaccharide biosynthesis